MKFNSLTIRRDWQGNLEGKLDVSGQHGSVSLKLNETMIERIMALAADGVVIAAKECAESLTAEAMTIPAKAIA